jgi:hypothetical protein
MFDKEINYIKSEQIKTYLVKALEVLPEYFYKIPASSSGKYHPKYTLGEGGLVRHTRAAVGIAKELFRLENYTFSDYEKDMIIVSLLLHDGCKRGVEFSDVTLYEHPRIVVELLKKNEDLRNILSSDDLDVIYGNILSHMGQWNKDETGKKILPKPKTKMQKFVHLCDYLASRKNLEYNFNSELE